MKPTKKSDTVKKTSVWYKNKKILGILGFSLAAIAVIYVFVVWMGEEAETPDQKVCAASGVSSGLIFSVPIKIPDEYEGCIATDEYMQEAKNIARAARTNPSMVPMPQVTFFCESTKQKFNAIMNQVRNMKLAKQNAKARLERQMQTCKDCYTAVIPTSSTMVNGVCYLENPKLGEYCKPIPNCTPGVMTPNRRQPNN